MPARALVLGFLCACLAAGCEAYDRALYARLLDGSAAPDESTDASTGADAVDVPATDDSGCPAGNVSCSGGCVDPSTDPINCGGCAQNCLLAAHVASATCVAGACAPSCVAGYGDCASERVNGCETALTTTANCSSCGHSCTESDPHASASCVAGACVAVCGAGYHLCSGVCSSDADPAHCGSSCVPCVAPANATTTCGVAGCGFECNSGFVLVGGACVHPCGDRLLEAGETCDDGNTVSGDGCSPSCQIEAPLATSCSDPSVVPHIKLGIGVQVYAFDLSLGFSSTATLCSVTGHGGFYLMDVGATGALTITLAPPSGVDAVIETRPNCTGTGAVCTNSAGAGGTETQLVSVTTSVGFAFIPISVGTPTGVVIATFDLT